jgi:hypothetical protein
MTKDLTTSAVARSNVLNNRYALSKLEEHLALGGLRIEGEVVFFKSHVAELLDIDERTIDRYIASHEPELKRNGYRVLKRKSLKNMKLAQVDDIHVVDLMSSRLCQAPPRQTDASLQHNISHVSHVGGATIYVTKRA